MNEEVRTFVTNLVRFCDSRNVCMCGEWMPRGNHKPDCPYIEAKRLLGVYP